VSPPALRGEEKRVRDDGRKRVGDKVAEDVGLSGRNVGRTVGGSVDAKSVDEIKKFEWVLMD